MMKQLVIIGAGRFGREVSAYAEESMPDVKVKGFLDSRADVLDGFAGYPPIIGTVEDYAIGPDDVFVCGVGEVDSRLAYAEAVERRGGRFVSIVHPKAYVGRNVVIGDGSVIAPGAIISNDTVIGRHVVVNSFSLVSHDCRVGDGCVLAPYSTPGSMATLGRCVFMGMKSCMIPGNSLGDDVYVAAGALVTKSYGSGGLLIGLPATRRERRA